MSAAKRFKLALLWLVRACGLFALARLLTRRGLMIIGWHGVSLTDEHQRFTSLFISPETFRRRLAFIKQHYRVIDLDEAMRQKAAGRFEPGQVVLTFDDGYHNFYARAAPALAEFGMTATVYVVTADMEEQLPVANLLVRDAFLSTRATSATLTLPQAQTSVSLATRRDRAKLVRQVLDTLEAMPPDPQPRFLFANQITRELEIDADDLYQRRVWHSINRNEARQLVEAGYSMQLHTHNHHDVVSHPATIYEQARKCRDRLEAVTGQPAVHYCYPAGMWGRHAWEPLRRAGVKSAVTVRSGPNFPQTPALALRRFLDGEDRSQLEFEFEMSNLRWLLWALVHPRSWYIPSEKFAKYREDGKLF